MVKQDLLIIIPCGRAKIWRNEPDLWQVAAKDAYIGAPFRVNRGFAEKYADRWVILSARYGFIDPERYILNYDNRFMTDEKKEAPSTIKVPCLINQIRELGLLAYRRVIVLGGRVYESRAQKAFSAFGKEVELPTRGLRIGQMMQFVNEFNPMIEKQSNSILSPTKMREDVRVLNSKRPNERQIVLEKFYLLLKKIEEKLGKKRLLAECDGRMQWPEKGVYYIFNPEEFRSRGNQFRVVRVGTHALHEGACGTLWQRLMQHRGPLVGKWGGGGNHRGSVFRFHVGNALMQRDNWQGKVRQTWGVLNSANQEVRKLELPFEKQVSNYIRNLYILSLPVMGKNSHKARKYIEENSIALLSNYTKIPNDPPGASWLGHFSPTKEIRESGLWNVRHVDKNLDPDFLEVFTLYVDQA